MLVEYLVRLGMERVRCRIPDQLVDPDPRATRQLRGESYSQVQGAKLAVAVGNGGQLGARHATGVTILAAD